MEKHLQKHRDCILFIGMLFFTVLSFGQSAGFNSTFIVLSVNGGSNAYYDLQASTGNPDFNGANLGTFCQGSNNLVFKGAEHNVSRLHEVAMNQDQAFTNILKLLIKNLSNF